MPWNGSGTFARLYNWVADAANGIKILASKQDDEINGLVTGLNNVLCKDGQNSPTANINWNSKKITNLGNGTLAGDAVNKSQLDALQGEWTQETSALSFGSTTAFKVTNANKTATYHAGRRLKTTNTGGTVYSTITSSSYSAPDTSVFVVNDSGVLDSGLSAAYYGPSQTQPSLLTPQSLVVARVGGAQVVNSGAGNTGVTFPTEDIDLLSEFASPTFTAKYAGHYLCSCQLALVPSSSVDPAQVSLNATGAAGYGGYFGGKVVAGNTYGIGATVVLPSIAAAGTIRFDLTVTGGANMTVANGHLDIRRLL